MQCAVCEISTGYEKDKFVSDHAIKTYRGSRCTPVLISPSRCILFDGEDISFDASLVIYINSTNIPPIMILNRI